MTRNDMSLNPSDDFAGNVSLNETDRAIKQLNSFLRGEISAAETYRMAIERAANSDDNAANIGLCTFVVSKEHLDAMKVCPCSFDDDCNVRAFL